MMENNAKSDDKMEEDMLNIDENTLLLRHQDDS